MRLLRILRTNEPLTVIGLSEGSTTRSVCDDPGKSWTRCFEKVPAIPDWTREDTAWMLPKQTMNSAIGLAAFPIRNSIPLRIPSAFNRRSMKSSFSSNWRLWRIFARACSSYAMFWSDPKTVSKSSRSAISQASENKTQSLKKLEIKVHMQRRPSRLGGKGTPPGACGGAK